jgi:antirestriction protein ArdC
MKKNVAELKAKLSVLEDELAFVTPDKLAKYLKDWKGGFHTYSLNNMLLAFMQRREGVTILAGYRQWQKVGRQVAKGQKALTILTPRFYKNKKDEDEPDAIYFKPGNVFDIGQTGIPRDVSIPMTGERLLFLDMVDQSLPIGGTQNATNSGDLTMDVIREKSPLPVVMKANMMEDGSTNYQVINIALRANEAGKIAAYFHELAHNFLGHKTRKLERDVEEIEAEATAYVVGAYFGIENPDAVKYIKAWKGDRSALIRHGKTVISTAEKIIKVLEAEDE